MFLHLYALFLPHHLAHNLLSVLPGSAAPCGRTGAPRNACPGLPDTGSAWLLRRRTF